jgi:hypothetical protein
MAKANNNPLANLTLAGLEQLDNIVHDQDARKAGFKAAVKPALEAVAQAPDLGPLSELPGTWSGTGFNLIQLPVGDMSKNPPPQSGAPKFRVELNSTAETLTFSAIAGGIFNRGNAQGDIEYFGLHYLQQVLDVNLPKDNNGIHLETGLFLNLPGGTEPVVDVSVARLGSIPHGDSLLAQGSYHTKPGGPHIVSLITPPVPDIHRADPMPFFIEDGKRTNDPNTLYTDILKNANRPAGITENELMDPNQILLNAISGQNIIETTTIFLDANPMDGVANVPVPLPGQPPVGGVTNIPFVNVNANATSVTAIFWIEKVQNADGTTFMQLQYTQTVILFFPVLGSDGTAKLVNWPHISVATLRLQP